MNEKTPANKAEAFMELGGCVKPIKTVDKNQRLTGTLRLRRKAAQP
jgi:hypothetical protein